MARRATQPATKPALAPPLRSKVVARPAKKSGAAVAAVRKLELEGLSAEQKVTALLRDRDKLLLLLAATQARVVALEAREAKLTDRIAWALDTLNDLLREAD